MIEGESNNALVALYDLIEKKFGEDRVKNASYRDAVGTPIPVLKASLSMNEITEDEAWQALLKLNNAREALFPGTQKLTLTQNKHGKWIVGGFE